MEPGVKFVVAARVEKVRRMMFTYLTQGFVGEKLVFETEIMGVVV